jgi:hypothetical protein
MTDVRTFEYDSAVDRVFGAILEKQTYKNVLYLLISYPLGVVYFVVLITGFAVGFPLALLFVGIPILLATFAVAGLFMRVERGLLGGLLNIWVPAPERPAEPRKGLIKKLTAHLDRTETWKGLAFLFLRFPMGIVSLIIVMALVPASLALLTVPLTYRFVPMTGGLMPIETFDQAIFFCSVGAILALISVHVINTWTAICRSIAKSLLS